METEITTIHYTLADEVASALIRRYPIVSFRVDHSTTPYCKIICTESISPAFAKRAEAFAVGVTYGWNDAKQNKS